MLWCFLLYSLVPLLSQLLLHPLAPDAFHRPALPAWWSPHWYLYCQAKRKGETWERKDSPADSKGDSKGGSDKDKKEAGGFIGSATAAGAKLPNAKDLAWDVKSKSFVGRTPPSRLVAY